MKTIQDKIKSKIEIKNNKYEGKKFILIIKNNINSI